MPLLHRKPFVRQKPPADIRPEEEVFLCKITHEIFRTYDEFFERTILCNSLVWSCSLTGRPGLTYLEAVDSEKRARQNLQSFPPALVLPLLHLASLTQRCRLSELCEDVYDFARQRFFPGETVDVAGRNGARCLCEILEVQSPSSCCNGQPKPTPVSNGNGKQPAEGDTIVISDSDDEDAAPKPQVNGVKRKSLTPGVFKYKVKLVKAEDSPPFITKANQINRKKNGLSRERLKLLLKQYCEPHNGFIRLKPSTVSKFGLSEQTFSQFFPDEPPHFPSSSPGKQRGRPLALTSPVQEKVDDAAVLSAQERDKMRREKEDLQEARRKEREDKERLREEFRRRCEEEKERRKEEKEKMKLEKEMEREKLKEEKKRYAERMKLWSKPREDMELEDLKELPSPVPVHTRVPPELFGDVLMVLEFLGAFGEFFDLKDEFPDGVSLEVVEEALVGSHPEGPLCELLFFFLSAIFQAQTEEQEEALAEELSEVREDETDRDHSAISAVASLTAAWSQLHQGCHIKKLDLDSCTLSEILRLHILSSGADCNHGNAKFRYQKQGGFMSTDDPCVELRLANPGILKRLARTPVYDLTPGEKLAILQVLCGKLLSLVSTRDFIEDNADEQKIGKQELRERRAEQHRRDREEAAYRVRVRKEEKLKEQEMRMRENEMRMRELEDKLREDRNGTAHRESLTGQNTEDEEDDSSAKKTVGFHQKEKQKACPVSLTAEEQEEELEKVQELQDRILKASCRTAIFPLGRDRLYRRYWIFPSTSALFVEDDSFGLTEDMLEPRPAPPPSSRDNGQTEDTLEEEPSPAPLRDGQTEDIMEEEPSPAPLRDGQTEDIMEEEPSPAPLRDGQTEDMLEEEPSPAPLRDGQTEDTLEEKPRPAPLRDGQTEDTLEEEPSPAPLRDGQTEDTLEEKPRLAPPPSQDGQTEDTLEEKPRPVPPSHNDVQTQDGAQQDNTPMDTPHSSPAAVVVAPSGPPVIRPNQWAFYSSVEEVEQLMEALNPRGHRESGLKEALLLEKDRITHILTSTEDVYKKYNYTDKPESSWRSVPESSAPAETYMENRLRDMLLDIEDRIYQGSLGMLKIMPRDVWKAALEKGQYELLVSDGRHNGHMNGGEDMELEASQLHISSKDRSALSGSCSVQLFRLAELRGEVGGSTVSGSSGTGSGGPGTPQPVNSTVRCLAHAMAQIEHGIERKFLQAPLGDEESKKDQKNKKNRKKDDDQSSEDGSDSGRVCKTILERWRDSLQSCSSLSQVFVHLSTLDRSVIWAKSLLNTRCKLCRRKGDAENMLLCDGCDRGHHLHCLRPKLKSVPGGDWFCPDCRPKQRSVRLPSRQRSSIDEEEEDEDEEESEEEEEEESEEEEEESEDDQSSAEEEEPVSKKVSVKLKLPTSTKGSKSAKQGGSNQNTPKGQQVSKPGGSNQNTPKGQQVSSRNSNSAGKNSSASKSSAKKATPSSSSKGTPVSNGRAPPRPGVRTSSRLSTEILAAPTSNPSSAHKRTATDVSPSSKPPKPVLLSGTSSSSRRSSGRNHGVHELSACEQLTVELVRHPDSWPFIKLVSKTQVPDYYDIIKAPIALSTIRERLNNCDYKTSARYIEDMALMFANCFQYNPRHTNEAKAGQRLQSFFQSELTKLGLHSQEDNTPPSKRSRT